jgi:hypothetical protein
MAIGAGFDVHRAQITFDALDRETGEVHTSVSGSRESAPVSAGFARREARCDPASWTEQESEDSAPNQAARLRVSSPREDSMMIRHGRSISTVSSSAGCRGVRARRRSRRPAGLDSIPFEDNRLVARPRHGERSREPRDPASGDDELYLRNLFQRPTQAATHCVCNATTRSDGHGRWPPARQRAQREGARAASSRRASRRAASGSAPGVATRSSKFRSRNSSVNPSCR